MRGRRLALTAAALAATAAAATACTDANGTEGRDYVAGDGIVIEVPAAERKSPVEVSGETLQGDRLDLADLRGNVVVVNVCPSTSVWTPSEPAIEIAVSNSSSLA